MWLRVIFALRNHLFIYVVYNMAQLFSLSQSPKFALFLQDLWDLVEAWILPFCHVSFYSNANDSARISPGYADSPVLYYTSVHKAIHQCSILQDTGLFTLDTSEIFPSYTMHPPLAFTPCSFCFGLLVPQNRRNVEWKVCCDVISNELVFKGEPFSLRGVMQSHTAPSSPI